MCIWICVFIACMSTNYEKYNHSMALSQTEWYTMVDLPPAKGFGRPGRNGLQLALPSSGPSHPMFFHVFSFPICGREETTTNTQQRVSLLHEPKKIGASLPFGELSLQRSHASRFCLIHLTQTTRNRFSYLENSWNLTQHAWRILNALLASIRQPPEHNFCLFHRAMWPEKKSQPLTSANRGVGGCDVWWPDGRSQAQFHGRTQSSRLTAPCRSTAQACAGKPANLSTIHASATPINPKTTRTSKTCWLEIGNF